MIKLELLAPAKDLEYGKAAINHGADAVYIGASRFSARKSAGVDSFQIEALARYAHLYAAKVYVAFNTILFDHELEDARRLIHELYQTGIDALIIQDMGILEMDLPPLPLHASTQTHNDSPEKVMFLEKAGFQRAILARELTLTQISDIKEKTNIELEAFIHGALCVSYSGQCYLSQSICSRSGNRGECAQPCRSSYDLKDARGNLIIKNKHLLSLKDLNLSASIPDLIRSGITSFKIEGRLKDLSYIKNVVSSYRKIIDQFLTNNDHYKKASTGHSNINFAPQIEKTYNRGYTNYNLQGRLEKLSTFHTQKSLGMEVGKVIKPSGKGFSYEGEALKAGDGICFFDQKNTLKGFNIQKVEGNMIYPSTQEELSAGTTLYRNFDITFENTLKQSAGERKIYLDFVITGGPFSIEMKVRDEESNLISVKLETEGEIARNQEMAEQMFKKQLGKLGNTPYELRKLEVNISHFPFLSASQINELRRRAIEIMDKKRIESYKNDYKTLIPNNFPFPSEVLDYRANIANHLSEKFYKRHQVKKIAPAFEINPAISQPALMITKHCIKYQLEACPRFFTDAIKLHEPIFLENQGNRYELSFDCKNCRMSIFEA